jgi:hypothetical protein
VQGRAAAVGEMVEIVLLTPDSAAI